MQRASRPLRALVLLTLVTALAAAPSWAARRRHEDTGFQLFTSPQSKPIVLSADGSRLYVANTTSNSVSVVSTASHAEIKTIEVGMDPVGLALRPDGQELWVANHVSDSVSVIDLNAANDTFEHVVATLDDFDANGATLFDEPTAIAFAGNAKAYVSLSSTNDIAASSRSSARGSVWSTWSARAWRRSTGPSATARSSS